MNTMKNIILLKNLPSNLVEEAIVVLKENTHIHKYQIKEAEEHNKKYGDRNDITKDEKNSINEKNILKKNKECNNTESMNAKDNLENKKGKKIDDDEYIIKEAEMIIKNYIDNLEKKSPKWKNNMKKLERRYKNSVRLNFILSFTTLIGLLFIII